MQVQGKISGIEKMHSGKGFNLKLVDGDDEMVIGCFNEKLLEGLSMGQMIKAEINESPRGNRMFYNLNMKPEVLDSSQKATPATQTMVDKVFSEEMANQKTIPTRSDEIVRMAALKDSIEYNREFNQDPNAPDTQVILNKLFTDAEYMVEFIKTGKNPFKTGG